jgi:hypothetical protein
MRSLIASHRANGFGGHAGGVLHEVGAGWAHACRQLCNGISAFRARGQEPSDPDLTFSVVFLDNEKMVQSNQGSNSPKKFFCSL